MGYGGGIYDHYGKEHDGRMDELERRERDLERRERELERDERELEKRERLHEREDEMYRRDGSVSVASVTSSMVPSVYAQGTQESLLLRSRRR